MKPQPMSDAEIDAMDTFALHVTAPGRRNGVRSYAAAIIAARDAQWAAMIGEPVAWVAAGGKAFSDRPMLSKAAADAAVAHRRDGSTVSPLYAIKETP